MGAFYLFFFKKLKTVM